MVEYTYGETKKKSMAAVIKRGQFPLAIQTTSAIDPEAPAPLGSTLQRYTTASRM